jgi:hypothetical protein
MRGTFALTSAAVIVLACGCGTSKSTSSDATTSPEGSPEGGVDSPAPPGSYTLTFGPIQVGPGVENTQCLVLRLGNPTAMHVGAIHNLLGTSSHHMIVYRVSDTTEQTTPFDCQPFTDTLNPADGSTLMVSQKKDDLLQLPSGVGYTLDANQMIRIEMHYINPTTATTTLVSTTTMIPIPDADYKYEAGFLFIGDPDISLPPNSKITLGPIFYPLPSEYAASNFFAITGHEHKLGTDVTISTATSATDPGTPVYDVPDWLWSEPATVAASPPFNVPAGGGFKFTCQWDNTTPDTVTFGESANDEMCFFWAYYYPSNGSEVCVHSDEIAGGINFCCPGSAFCSYLTQ